MATEYRAAEFQSLFAIPLRNGLTRPKSVRGAGIKMVNMGEIFGCDRIGDIPMDRVPVSERELRDFRLEKGDLLFARQSLVAEGAGKCSIVLEAPEPLTFESHIIRARLDPEVACPAYYYYFFTSSLGRQIMGSIVEQVAAAGIRGSDLARLGVPHPPIREQRAIARILSAFDDKIELNRRMNATLEAMARALFKSWFVDFEPVRAKDEGQPLVGINAELAALFPDGFDESEVGEIPHGWAVAPIGDAVRVVGGSTPSTHERMYWEGGTIYWATPKDLASLTSPVLLDTERQITERGLAQISSGLLPEGTVLLSSRAPVGYLAISEVPTAINQGFIAMVCDKELSNHYVLRWAEQNMEVIKSRANGTTFQEISKTNFRPIPALIPPVPIIARFTQIAGALHQQIVHNLRETRTLATIRGVLLPKLLSGEVRVKEAEEAVAKGALA